ncbi:hypothetical protein BC01_091 [Bacillus phage BC01]|nr:hypothetical protein BC01_091 [Bacillus phage BC01]
MPGSVSSFLTNTAPCTSVLELSLHFNQSVFICNSSLLFGKLNIPCCFLEVNNFFKKYKINYRQVIVIRKPYPIVDRVSVLFVNFLTSFRLSILI